MCHENQYEIELFYQHGPSSRTALKKIYEYLTKYFNNIKIIIDFF